MLIDGETVQRSSTAGLVRPVARLIADVTEFMTLLPGETVDTEVRFPDDHPDESRRGQTRKVRVTLHEVKRQELPALDDAFAREVGDQLVFMDQGVIVEEGPPADLFGSPRAQRKDPCAGFSMPSR